MKDFDTPTAETRETAAEAPTHYFQGIPLHPFSFSRQAACQRVAGDAASRLENATILVYICTLTPEEVERTRDPDLRIKFYAAMGAWADKHRISLASEAGKQVQLVAAKIWAELHASDFKVQPKKGEKREPVSPNESGREPQRRTSRKSRPSSTAH